MCHPRNIYPKKLQRAKIKDGEFWWVSGGTSQDGVTDLSTSQVNLIPPRRVHYNLDIISSEDALRRPMTYDDHPIQSSLGRHIWGFFQCLALRQMAPLDLLEKVMIFFPLTQGPNQLTFIRKLRIFPLAQCPTELLDG